MLQRDRAVLTALLDLCTHITQTCRSVPDPQGTFLRDYLFQTRLCSSLIQLAQLNGDLSDQLQEAAPPISWEVVDEVRDAYAIYCDPGNLESVWDVLRFDVPMLAAFYQSVLTQSETGGTT